MGSSIKGFLGKIKALVDGILGDRELFSALLIVTIGIASFGLGRLSVAPVEHGDRPNKASPERVLPVTPAAASETLNREQEGTEVSGEASYVASKNSNKYHLPWCSGARRIAEENKIWFATKEEAEAAGYTPAANCKGI